MALKRSWLKTALDITGDFETAGNPWATVTGDFDQMGISCGVLQWNIGQGSLQPIVQAGGKSLVLKLMPNFGKKFWEACGASKADGLKIVRSWQTGNVLQKAVKTELEKFFGSEKMIEKQIDRAAAVGEQAYALAKQWAKDERGAKDANLREVCWFFDLVTQNGGTKGLWLADVKSFIEFHEAGEADDFICEWLENQPPAAFGRKDAVRNAALWRDKLKSEHLNLFVLGFLRALKSRPEYQGLVMNRRGTLAATRGWVNGEQEDFKALR